MANPEYPDHTLEPDYYENLRHDARKAITDVVAGMLEAGQYSFAQDKSQAIENLHVAVDEYCVDETAVIGISLDDEIDLIELYGEELNISFAATKPDTLRRDIDIMSTMVVDHLARGEAYLAIGYLESFMEEHDLTADHIVGGNNHGWARHFAERTEGSHCQVYEYRNLEGEGIHVDVWEYGRGGLTCHFETAPDDVSPEEKCFDAT